MGGFFLITKQEKLVKSILRELFFFVCLFLKDQVKVNLIHLTKWLCRRGRAKAKTVAGGATAPEFKSYFCHILALWSGGAFVPACLRFLVCKIGQVVVARIQVGNVDSIVHICKVLKIVLCCPGGSAVKNPPASARDEGSVPGLGRSLGEGNGSPLQYSCLGNPMDRGAWQATVHGVAKSRTPFSE